MNAAARSAVAVIRSCLSNLSERELAVACRVANVPKEALVAFMDERGGLTDLGLSNELLSISGAARGPLPATSRN